MTSIHAHLRYIVLACTATALGACGGASDATGTDSGSSANTSTAWDVTMPRGDVREIDFTTDVGTWMSVDTTPSGEWLVFDLLGHIYRVPGNGGDAECLTQDSGIAVNSHPRVSPDGSLIAFISDRGGHNNLWVMNIDGSGARLIASESEKRVTEPAWGPDGEFIYAQRSYNGNRWISEGIWRYPAAGGAPEPIVETVAGSPSVDDEHTLYFHTYAAVDPKLILHADYSISFAKAGQSVSGAVGQAGDFAPQVSPDGKLLAFVRRHGDGVSVFDGAEHGPPTTLWIRDLASGEERLLLNHLDPDIGETGGDLLQQSRLVSGYSWSRDGRSIVTSHDGRLKRVNVDDGEISEISFTARVHRVISERAATRTAVDDSPVRSRFLRWARTSPDGRYTAVQAFGRIWLTDNEAPDVAPRRLTTSGFGPLEYAPAWSPDGQWIAFAAWDHEQRGSVWKINVSSGEQVELTAAQAEFLNLDWSPDGSKLVLAMGESDLASFRYLSYLFETDIVILDANAGGVPQHVIAVTRMPRTRAIVSPSFAANGRIYYTQDVPGDDGPRTQIRSIAADGTDVRHHATVPFSEIAAPSPDGTRFAVKSVSETYLLDAGTDGIVDIATLPYAGGTLGPVTRISPLGGLYPHWLDGRHIEFVSADTVYRYDTAAASVATRRIEIEQARAIGTEVIAYTGARVVTLGDAGVLESATVIVAGDRIACVGDCDTASADRKVDVAGKTIIPGIIDLHNSPSGVLDLITPRDHSQLRADLAFGVTTAFSTSMWSEVTYPLIELIETGEILGPRVFASSDKLRWDKGPYYVDSSTFDMVNEQVYKTKSWGATGIKQYLRERDRAARQMVAEAARAHDMAVTAHLVKGLYEYGISLALDGYTAHQHTPVQMPFRSDAAEFFAQAEIMINATLGVASGLMNHGYYLQRPALWDSERLRRFMPPARQSRLAAHAAQPLRPKSDYFTDLNSQALNAIVERGGLVTVASHGEYPGLSPHFEIWILAEAMGPLRALESASLDGAKFIGADDDLGSIESGKIADFVVLNADPLERIENTLDVAFVVKAGRVFDDAALEK